MATPTPGGHNYVDYSSKDRGIVVEELEKKLKCRAEKDSLIQKNILPAVSTSSLLLAHTQQLQRAKTADTLQQKLRDRVSKSELQKRNILPNIQDGVDPSLHAHHLQLQKKQLADNLNDRLAHRPGVLELVEERILEPTNVNLAHVAKTVRTSMVDEVDSEGSPPEVQRELKISDSSSPITSPGDPYTCELASPQKSPPRFISSSPAFINRTLKIVDDIGKSPSPSQSRKKQQKGKYKKLRYHEYVPPNKNNSKGGKTAPSKPPKLDTPYALLLQQQQIFLQLQVLQQQYPNGVLAQKLPELLKNMPPSLTEKAQLLLKPKTGAAADYQKAACLTKTHEIPEDIKVRSATGEVITVRLDELKVNQLKVACKEMNLIVSGKKIELIERLLDHNNGLLPSSVLQDSTKKSMSHTSSIDSLMSNTSPESSVPSPVFQYPKHLNSSSTSSFFQSKDIGCNNSMETADLPEVLSAAEFQSEFDQLMERQKVDYFSSRLMKAVAPRPDLKHMVAIRLPCSKILPAVNNTAKMPSLIHSQSLPSSPQQLSPSESTNSLLQFQELMEQSPLPGPPSSFSPVPSSTSYSPVPTSSQAAVTPDPLVHDTSSLTPLINNTLISANQYLSQGRPVRSSLPNPPPYPGQKQPSFDSLPSNPLYYNQRINAMNQRSYSISGASSAGSHQVHSLSELSPLTQSSKPLVNSTDDFLFPVDDTLPSSDLMDIDHRQLTDLLEYFDQGEQGGGTYDGANSTFNSQVYNQQQQQSSSNIYSMHHNHHHHHQQHNGGGMMNTDLSLMMTASGGDIKPTIIPYNEIGWLDGNSLLSDTSTYPNDIHNSAHSYEHFQLGLEDVKNSSGSINFLAAANNHSYMDGSSHQLYGQESLMMNLDLAS